MGFFKNPFFDALEKTDRSALVFSDGNENVHAGEIRDGAVALAHGLVEKGFAENDRVVLIVPPGKEFLEIFFAVGLLKGVIAIIDPEMGRDNFEAKLRQLNPKWVFIDSRLILLREHPIIRFFYLRFAKKPFYISIPENADIITTGKRLPLLTRSTHVSRVKKKESPGTVFASSVNHDLIITYTSGTLDEPKGVVHTVDSLFESLSQIKHLLGTDPQTRIGAYLPHFLLIGICAGFPVFLFPKEKDAAWKYNFFREHGITTLFGPPSDFLPLINHCKVKHLHLPDCIHLVMLGSAPVYPRFLEQLYAMCKSHVKVLCLYGMTENLVVCAADGKEKMASQLPGDFLGKPIDGVKLSFAADHEIFVGSSQLFSRYLHANTRGTPHPTGDLGYLSENGELILTGRKKDMIIRRDTNIYPAIYEKTIRSIPGIHEAVMIGKYREDLHDEEVILFVECDVPDEQKLFAQLTSGVFSIDKEAIPDKIIFTTIPRSGRQDKVDRNALRKLLS